MPGELRERIADGLTLRQFTDFYCAPVPKHDAFRRSFVRLSVGCGITAYTSGNEVG
jgi:hypothetical protein